jgi:hypothetical protein
MRTGAAGLLERERAFHAERVSRGTTCRRAGCARLLLVYASFEISNAIARERLADRIRFESLERSRAIFSQGIASKPLPSGHVSGFFSQPHRLVPARLARATSDVAHRFLRTRELGR